jgi:hypothetical protein
MISAFVWKKAMYISRNSNAVRYNVESIISKRKNTNMSGPAAAAKKKRG